MLGYLRVSTEDQADNGHGLNAQRATIQAEADRRGDQELRWIEDARSGKNMERPGLTYALSLLAAGDEDTMIVAKLDRLSRSITDFGRILEHARKHDWTLVVADMNLDLATPMGEVVANVLMSFAQFERRMIGVRTKEGLAAARAKGVKLGGDRGTAKPRVPADVERRIRRARADRRTYRDIAEELNRDGVPTANGGREWYAATVRYVCQRRNLLPL